MNTTTLELPSSPRKAPRPTPALSYIEQLTVEASRHRALNHPWLFAISHARLPDMERAVREFAQHYHGYSAWFPRFLNTAIQRLEEPMHRELLLMNLAEEYGHLDPDDRATLADVGIPAEAVDGVPHPELFRRFCDAVGIEWQALANPSESTRRWRAGFLSFLEQASPAAAVGALGLGTEGIVKPIYNQIVNGLQRMGTLTRADYVFFELHTIVDDQHQQDLLLIAEKLSTTEKGRRELRKGMLAALDLRCQFWDFLYQQAINAHRVA